MLLTPKQKKDQKSSTYDNELASLPNIAFKAREMTGGEKALNLWPRDCFLLDFVSYANGILTVKMKDGKTLSGPIRQFSATFENMIKYNGTITADLKYNGQKVCIYYYAFIFSDEQWNEIFAYLLFYGETYGAEKLTGNKKNTAMEVLKGIKLGVKIFKAFSN